MILSSLILPHSGPVIVLVRRQDCRSQPLVGFVPVSISSTASIRVKTRSRGVPDKKGSQPSVNFLCCRSASFWPAQTAPARDCSFRSSTAHNRKFRESCWQPIALKNNTLYFPYQVESLRQSPYSKIYLDCFSRKFKFLVGLGFKSGVDFRHGHQVHILYQTMKYRQILMRQEPQSQVSVNP